MNKENPNKIKSFVDLDAWREGHKLVLMIYKETSNFPQKEIFGLTSQMRRAAVSITSQIAEGFSRQSYKEKIRFYSISQGSNTELQNQLLIARDIGYLNKESFNIIAEQSIKGLLPNWLWLQFPSFGCAKFVNRRHTLRQVCLLFSHLARAKSENFASKLIRQQTHKNSQTIKRFNQKIKNLPYS